MVRSTVVCRCGLKHSGLRHYGLEHSGLNHCGLRQTGLKTAGLKHSGLNYNGLKHSCLKHSSLKRDVFLLNGFDLYALWHKLEEWAQVSKELSIITSRLCVLVTFL